MSKSRAHLLRGEALGGRRFFPEVVFTVHPKAIPTVLEIFEKALIWDNTAQKQRVNSFTKNMTPEGQEGIWSFSYDSDSQASTLYADNGFGTNVRLSITDVKKYTQLYTHFS